MKDNHRDLIVTAWRDAAATAEEAAQPATNGANAEVELARRVHRFRKAVRRARAVLELAWDALPRDLRRDALFALRAPRRALGDARDHSVVPHVLAQLELSDVLRASANQILGATQTPMASEVQSSLDAGAILVREELARLTAALPEAVSWRVVRTGIERMYRRARRARKRAKRDAHQFHVWRRRSKELSYQLDLLARAFGEPMTAIAHDLAPVLEAQSAGVDLIMLCHFLRAHTAAVPGIIADPLLDELDARIAEQSALARRFSKPMFETKPADYARAVRRAGKVELPSEAAAD